MKWLNLLAIKFMQYKSMLGGNPGTTTGDGESVVTLNDFKWVKDLNATLRTILVPILSVVAAAGAIYAVVIAIQMAKADSGEKREEAKKRLISVIVAVVVLAVLILFFLVFMPMILKAVLKGRMPGMSDADLDNFFKG